MKGDLTITRQRDRNDKDHMHISVSDNDSRIHIIDIKVSLKEFMLALTGLAYRPIEIERMLSIDSLKRVGKICETKEIFIDKPPIYNENEQQKFVRDSVALLKEYKDWIIFNDGCRSQQPTSKHRVVLRRWI